MANRIFRAAGLCTALLISGLAMAQTPTHIDPGTSDDSVHITDDLGYILLILGLLVLMVGWFIILRKRMKKRD